MIFIEHSMIFLANWQLGDSRTLFLSPWFKLLLFICLSILRHFSFVCLRKMLGTSCWTCYTHKVPEISWLKVHSLPTRLKTSDKNWLKLQDTRTDSRWLLVASQYAKIDVSIPTVSQHASCFLYLSKIFVFYIKYVILCLIGEHIRKKYPFST